MCCYAGKLLQQAEMNNPTIVVVTDRNDLDGQLYATFCQAQDLLKQTPLQANDRDELRELLMLVNPAASSLPPCRSLRRWMVSRVIRRSTNAAISW
jgi:hypothetical protein